MEADDARSYHRRVEEPEAVTGGREMSDNTMILLYALFLAVLTSCVALSCS